MEAGMMWADNDPKKPLHQKVNEGAKYALTKYGVTVRHAAVSAREHGKGFTITEGVVEVNALNCVLPGHIWFLF